MPNTRVKVTTTYTIDEHPDPDKVFGWIRDNWHDLHGDDWQEGTDTWRAFCEHFGLTDCDWCLTTCGPSHMTARVPDPHYDDSLAELSGVRLWKYLNNSGRLRYFNKYRKAMADLLDGECPFTGVCYDETLLDPIREFMTKPIAGTTYQDLIDECGARLAAALVTEAEYRYSDEALQEMCEANEYEFTENGSIY